MILINGGSLLWEVRIMNEKIKLVVNVFKFGYEIF